MLRSVHMKLVMIMVLLILSLMAVVGAFLINSVMAFYLEEFYTQMSQVFDQSQNPALSRTLQTENSGEENGAEAVLEIMQAYSGELGLDGRSRTLYILDGETGAYLAGTDEAEGRGLEYNSPNLTRALVEKEEGTQANIAADYMDVALPFSRGGVQYVIYILDNKSTVNNLINQIFVLILESLVFGLFISILLSFLLSKTMIIPIQRLTEGAMRVAEGDFSRRIEVTSRDEIGVLTDTFNDMARQLRDTLRAGLRASTPLLGVWPWRCLKSAMAMACSSTEEGRAAVRRMFDQLTRREFLRGWRGIAQCLHPEKHFSFDAPLLVCRGERDRTGTIARHMEDWKRAWPETETAVLPGAAHVVNLDAPEAFNRLLLDFLTRCGGSRRGRR